MQIVYLSARPSLLCETLEHVAHFAPFLDDVVVITPEAMRKEVTAIPGVDTVLTDEDLCELRAPLRFGPVWLTQRESAPLDVPDDTRLLDFGREIGD